MSIAWFAKDNERGESHAKTHSISTIANPRLLLEVIAMNGQLLS